MTTFIYPAPDAKPWPTLGPFVCDFIEDNLCYGPGDLLGVPVTLSEELRAWIYRMYEVEPPYVVTGKGRSRRRRKNPRAGRRRFQRSARARVRRRLPPGSRPASSTQTGRCAVLDSTATNQFPAVCEIPTSR